MSPKETPANIRTTRRRQTRGAGASDEEPTEPVSEPLVVRKSTRRISVTMLEPEEAAPAITETASHQNHVRCSTHPLTSQVEACLPARLYQKMEVPNILDLALRSIEGVPR